MYDTWWLQLWIESPRRSPPLPLAGMAHGAAVAIGAAPGHSGPGASLAAGRSASIILNFRNPLRVDTQLIFFLHFENKKVYDFYIRTNIQHYLGKIREKNKNLRLASFKTMDPTRRPHSLANLCRCPYRGHVM